MNIGILGFNGRMGKLVMEEALVRGWNPIELTFQKQELEKQLKLCDGVIEFSSSGGVELLLELSNIPLVLASTALSEVVKNNIIEKCKNIPIFYSSNYSSGLFKMMMMIKKSTLQPELASICEKHHINKKDAPSGTALMLKEFLEIDSPITSLREGDVFGEHTIAYNLGGEVLTFKHEALSRVVFAKGACDALNFLIMQKAGLFSMGDLYNV